MCKCLKISRSSYYYEVSSESDETALEEQLETVFHENRAVYGSRKIKKELAKQGLQISRRRICRIMKRLGLVSAYTVAIFHPCKTKANESMVKNELARLFDGQKKFAGRGQRFDLCTRQLQVELRVRAHRFVQPRNHRF